MPIYVMEHGYYDDKCLVSILQGPVGADMGSLYQQWPALLGGPVVTPHWREFIAWLCTLPGWAEQEFSVYNLEDGADMGIQGSADIHAGDQWGEHPTDAPWPNVADHEPCPQQAQMYWMTAPPRHFYIAARLADGTKIWRCRHCGKTHAAPIPAPVRAAEEKP